jgi:hypothetical protein
MKDYIKQLWKKPHLANILYFLEIFQYQKEGIKQKHLRYFLMNDHNLEFMTQMDRFYERNKFFFEEFAPSRNDFQTREDIRRHLNKLETIKDVKEQDKQKQNFILSLWRTGNIKTEGALDQCLRRLCRNGVIKKANRKKPFHYVTTIEYEKNYQDLRMLEYIERWDIRDKAIISPVKLEGHHYDTSIYGASGEEFTEEDTKKIAMHLEVICDNLAKILELKTQKTLPLLNGANEVDKAKLTSIDFFYHGSL